VLGYGAFGPVTVLRDRTARLTQPTLDARSARADCDGWIDNPWLIFSYTLLMI